MALTFRLKALTAPPGQQCLTTLQGVLGASEKYLQVIGPDGFSGTIISENEPGVDDRDKSWIRLESNGKPRGTYVYKEGWILVPGVHIGAIMFYSGTLANIPAGWFLANGLNGSPDLTDATTASFAPMWKPDYAPELTAFDLCLIWFGGLA